MSFENKLDRPLLLETPRESLGPLVRETVRAFVEAANAEATEQGQGRIEQPAFWQGEGQRVVHAARLIRAPRAWSLASSRS